MKNTIYNEDCIEGMKKIDSDSIDLVVADPPYALFGTAVEWKEKNFKKVNEDWDSYTLEAYEQFTSSWLAEAKRILKPTGSMWVFGSYHGIGCINVEMQRLGITILNEVIWYKRNAFPNVRCSRLTASHESILWGCKSKEYIFNYDSVKSCSFEDKELDTQLRDVWDIPSNKVEGNYGHPTQKPLSVLNRIMVVSGIKQ